MRVLPLLAVIVWMDPRIQIPGASDPRPPRASFADVGAARGIAFRYLPFHTSRKYLIETMGGGIALVDYDNDGRLDLFLVNGAALADPTPKGTVPRKTSPAEWNRLYHQRADGSFEDVTEKAGVAGT